MSNARNLSDLLGTGTTIATAKIADAVFNANKNLIINGGMTIAQRSVSETAQHTSGYITCDRFNLNFVNEDELRLTVTQEADGPSGFANSLKLQTTTAESAVAADEELRVIYRAEAQDLQSLGFGTSAAKKFTVSFYVKSTVAATYGFNVYQSDSNEVFGQAYTINSANTWERKTITVDANTSNAINDDNGIGLQLNWFLMAGSNFTSGSNSSWETFAAAKHAVGHTANAVATTTNATWQITGVQLEVGEQATPFEHRSFGDELARCQRYYYSNSTTSKNAIAVKFDNTRLYRGTYYLPVTMRTTPAADVTSISYQYSGSNQTGTVLSVDAAPDVLTPRLTAGAASNDDGTAIICSIAGLVADAEL
tara:strand:+ start:887 stop:1984 length:1098 start_codon:yes stop_codon:yes gene_type:complete